MRSLPQPPRRTRSEGLVALLAALAVSSVGAREWEWHEEITPEKELRWAQRNYAEGTNFTVRGMFREAESRIGGGIGALAGLGRRLAAGEDLRRLEPAIRTLTDDLERAREELKAERARPFDADRALRIAQEYVDAALGKIKAPGGEFLGAAWDLDCARAYLDDIGTTEALKEAVAEVEASIAEAKRLGNLAGVRYCLQTARNCLEKDRPDNAIQNIRHAEEIYLPRGKGDPAFEELSKEVADLRRAAERKMADMEHARDLAAIERCREVLGDPGAPVLPATVLVPEAGTEEELRRLASEADFAGILRRELSESEFDLLVSRGHGSRIGFRDDPEFLPTLRAALTRAVNTNYPSAFPGGEHFAIFLCIPFKPGAYDSFCPRTRTDADGRKVGEVVPRIRRLDVIRTSAQPDDAYLYFDGDAGVLFEPGGRTALFPGLGALLAGKLPKSRADRKTAPITFRNEAKPDLRSAPPAPRVLPAAFVLPEIPQEWRQ